MNIFKYLNSPVPVARFQRLCGLRWKNPDPKNPIFPIEQPSTSRYDAGGTPNTKDFYLSNKLFFFIAKSGSELTEESFYSIFLPACSWLFDITVSRRTLIAWVVSMYVGQILKSFIKQPIPASPPVIRLGGADESEYGMPSTHTVTAVTVPFSFLVFASDLYQVPVGSGAVLAGLWSSTVIISRLYLGMHNLLETAAGAVLSFIVLSFHPVVTWLEEAHLKSSSLMSFAIGVGSLLLARALFLNSDLDQPAGLHITRNNTVDILGWCSGFLIGSKYSICRNVLAEVFPDASHSAEISYSIIRCFVRFNAGAAMLTPTHYLLRKLLLCLLIRVHGFSNIDADEAERKCPIQLPYRFFTGFLSGLISTAVIPPVLQYLKLW